MEALETHPKKRIEIVVEAPLRKRLLTLLDREGVNGYTVLPAIEGRGEETDWQRDGQVSLAGQMLMVVCIVDPSRADEVVEAVYNLLARQFGIVTISDIEVIRGEKF